MSLANKLNFDHTLSPPSGCDVNAVETNDSGTPVLKQAFGVPRMVGDSGSGGTGGAVPAPASGDAAAGKFLKADGTWEVPAGSGSGTVTSVGMTGDGTVFDSSVTGSPITTSGTLAPSLKNQSANQVLAGPSSGSAAAPTFRSLVNADLPPYEFGANLPGKPTDGQVVFLAGAPGAGTFPASFSGSAGSVGTNPTATAVYTVKKAGTTIGTISISTGGVFTFATTGSPQASQSFSKDDRISVTAPSPVDSTLSDVCIRLEATRS